MSRLLEVLKQQEELKERQMIQAAIDGKLYKKFSDVGNLFRLMLVNNDDHTFPVVGKQNLVASMLPNLAEDDDKAVKALQTEFNKIKKIIKANKKPTIAMKKKYFNLLFGLLIPLTGQANLKQQTLVNNFSANSEQAKVFKRRATALIGKSLLKKDAISYGDDKELKLKPLDKTTIRGLIMGLDEMENDEQEIQAAPSLEPVQPQEEVELAPVEEQITPKLNRDVNVYTQTEVLQQNIIKTAPFLEETQSLIAEHQENANIIREGLLSNTDPKAYYVNQGNMSIETKAVIDEKIAYQIQNFKEVLGQEYANFLGKFLQDAFENLDNTKGFLDFNKDNIRINARPDKASFIISMSIGNPMNDEELFVMERSFYQAPDGLHVKNEKLQIPGSLQGTDINKNIFKDALDLYKAKGVAKVELEANVDVGGYAWFRYGFTPIDTNQITKIGQWIINVLPKVYSALQYDALDISDYIYNRTFDKTQDTLNLAELLKQGQTPDSEQVLKKLAKACQKEFVSSYNDKTKFGTMQDDVAFKNFKSIKHNGKNYSISYKALLSIQAAKDDTGFSMIPMNDGVYLDWLGELDMNNLERTYKYMEPHRA